MKEAQVLQPSVARGLAVAVALMALFLVGRQATRLWPAPLGESTGSCAAPVEVDRGSTALLGCGDEMPDCGALRPGDRVVLRGGRCLVDAGAMSQGMRQAAGLGLDLNRATAEELEGLKGIGPKLAGAIIEDRQMRGPFPSVGALQRVRGIGPKTVKALRGKIVVVQRRPTADREQP